MSGKKAYGGSSGATGAGGSKSANVRPYVGTSSTVSRKSALFGGKDLLRGLALLERSTTVRFGGFTFLYYLWRWLE